MTAYEITSVIINALIAIGTIAVAVLAIWGESIKARFFGPKLSLIPYNLRGSVVPITHGPRSIFYDLEVVNKRSTVVATNCRVLLKKLWRRVPNGEFQEVHLAVPLTFVWAPAEITPPYIRIKKDHVLDFGLVIEGQDHFSPRLISITNNFGGFVHANEVVRFGLEIVSDNFVSASLQVIEVAWNGQWNDNLDVMAQNLQIQEVHEHAD